MNRIWAHTGQKTMSRILTKKSSLIVLGVAAAIVIIYFVTRPRLNVEGFGVLQRGMTQEEIEKILGGPPGNYGFGKPTISKIAPTGVAFRTEEWIGESMCVSVRFDEAGRSVNMWRSSVTRGICPFF